ncbi:hypothetical protein MO867_11600 [Microbulbifer sp. OS29]|uniref:FAD dependent oxidoreductase domain-containing protein n=1 Tax=Microbulbifer okhotskensis TaxID=2926617 RepID=A0A9X2J6T9_9GAMM|nr:FAD-dependent oxidoreductase [Microbulbifer okhotskensis]MCO1334980.1 hypothetical protein [Microbulbifer okhotskensis]
MPEMVEVDILVLGGGIQAVTLLRELSPEFSVIAVNGGLFDAESLHFHGYFSSGWNAAHPKAAKTYREAAGYWRKLLEASSVNSRLTAFYAALPRDFVDIVEPNWLAAGISAEETTLPTPFLTTNLPSHQSFKFDDDLVFDDAEAYLRLSAPVASHIVAGRADKIQREGSRVTGVTVNVGESQHQVKPQLLLSACGAGNAGILEMMGVAAETVDKAQLVRPLHMLLARGARVPPVSAFLFDLVVVYHPLEQGEGLWILSLNPEHPKFRSGTIDMATPPPIEKELIRDSLERLSNCMAGFDDWVASCQWGVYTGWKTDAPGPDGNALMQLNYPCPYYLERFEIDNFLSIWPNHWGLAAAAAREAGEWVRSQLKSRHPQPDEDSGLRSGPGSGQAIEDRWLSDKLVWQSWEDFVRQIGYRD